MGLMRLRSGKPQERDELERLQFRSSIALPAYRDAILQHPESIELPLELFGNGRVRVAEVDGSLIGFAVTLAFDEKIAELDGLFVEPTWWGRRVGTALLRDALDRARGEGATAMDVTANPQAVQFYARFGFVCLHETPTQFGPAWRMRCSFGADTT
jgi:GNAT superfamily N-acetyltransferase